jgi:hypothetical protein
LRVAQALHADGDGLGEIGGMVVREQLCLAWFVPGEPCKALESRRFPCRENATEHHETGTRHVRHPFGEDWR